MSKQIKSLPILLINRDLIVVSVLKIALIFFLVEEEFALFGHAVRFDADGIGRGVPDVSVRTENGRTCTTNENGFYALIVNKHDLPGKLIFRYDGRVYEYPFGEFPDTDWEIIDATIP